LSFSIERVIGAITDETAVAMEQFKQLQNNK